MAGNRLRLESRTSLNKLPIGVITKAAECLWSEPSMVPKLMGCAGAGVGVAFEGDLP